ncbi:RNA polymerase sigma factor for flagellar operon FliA [Candidatus Gastranaerophilus sp. (ex Termes propinquus)]|nr:RNA polymerase sigma factor for flagellar operon FliA [Candidatus Gastranaerophilus sp. (ex Termes propinquus)]
MTQSIDVDSYKKIVRVSDEELKALWEAYIADRNNKLVRDKLIVQYIYLTRYVIGRIKVGLPPSFTYEDIASYGVEGLIDAVEKFSPNKGAKFETYALMRIRGSIIDRIRSQDWLPRTLRKKIKDIKLTTERLKQELGRAPTTKEIADVMGLDSTKIEEILAQDTGVGSLYDKKGSSDESVEVIDTIEDENSERPEEVAERKDAKRELELALKRLPERERTLLIFYYHENMTLKEIGEAINVSESRVCQLHAQAIMKLRNILSAKRNERLTKAIV